MFEADLADRVDDLICIFEGGNPYDAMDSLTMLLMGWFLFLFSSLLLLKYIYQRYVKKGTKEIIQDKQQTAGLEKNNSAPRPNDIYKNDINATARPATANNNIVTHSAKLDQQNVTQKKSAAEFAASRSTWSSLSVACTGPDAGVVDYIDKCFSWLYSPNSLSQNATCWDNVKDALIDSLGRTLREQGKKELPLFVSVVDIKLTNQIQISNLYAECEHTNNIKITCDLEATKLNGVLSLYSTDMGSSSCEFFIDRICGRLNILLDCDEQAAIVKFDGWPEICVGIKSSSSDTKLDSKTSEYLAEKLATAIRSAVLEIEFKKFSAFPAATCLFTPGPREQGKKYLVVKILGGIDLGLSKGCEEPFCAIELDDPPQKFQTEHQPNSASNPMWNENFVFNILPSCGGELLFEVFDYVGTRFLGCNIISVDEILNYDFGQTRTIPLKSRRMEMADQISGNLQVQFSLVEQEQLVEQAKVETLKGGKGSSKLWNGNLKDLEISSKNTLVVQPTDPPKQIVSRPIVKITRALDGSILEVDEDEIPKKKGSSSDGEQTIVEGTYGEERGRRRTRRGDIFTSIRRRFSKGRSISLLPPASQGADKSEEKSTDVFGRSISADRKSTGSGANNTTLGLNSTRSSASELSGLSGQSTTTFIHENSTLVIECIENRVKKYYLVPPHLAETGKWKKSGKKLHIYNDHTFVAKRLQSGTPCAVCFGRFQFSLGKQGYQCRDCKVKCHKECHVRVPTFCPNTTVYDIELVAVKPLPPAPATKPLPPKKDTKSTSPLKSFTALFGSRKKVHPSEQSKLPEAQAQVETQVFPASPQPKLNALDDEHLKSGFTKKSQTLGSAATLAVPPMNEAPVPKSKSAKRRNIFKRKAKLPKIQEENPVSANHNSTSSPAKSAGDAEATVTLVEPTLTPQESTVSNVLQNEEEDLPEQQEVTAVLQIKCNTIIVNKNIKNYSVE